MPDDPEQYMRRVKGTIVGLVMFSIVVYWPVLGFGTGEVDPSLAAVPVLVVAIGALFAPRIYRNYRRAKEAETTTRRGETAEGSD